MRHLTACLTIAALVGALPARAEDVPARALAITGVTVIDATGAPAQPGMTVVVTGDRITAVGKSGDVRVPQGARVVDGNGKYLIPGLWDMHVHSAGPSYLALYLANGVTGVRDMHALDADVIFGMRKQVQEGRQSGPRIVAAGPLVDGPKPFVPGSLVAADAGQGREAVRKLKQMGADFVKVYTKLPRETYLAIVDEAKKQGLPLAGHVPESVSAAEASDLGQKSIEHLTGVELACSDREDELRREAVAALSMADNQAAWELLGRIGARAADSFSDEKARALYARFVRNGTRQVPTLTVLRSLVSLDEPSFIADPRVKYMPPSFRSYWSLMKLSPETVAGLKRRYKGATGLVRAMHQAGVPLLAGTDTPGVPYVFPGFSLHDELALFVEAGLSPMDALQTATLNPAKFLGRENDLGIVAKGKLADLVLLDADPLQDIKNTKKISSVIVGGTLLTRETLDKMLADVEAEANKPAAAAAGTPALNRTDLNILRKADEILADESKWNRKCERRYAKEDKTWSLYTALHKACLEVTGKFEHRQPALEEVRKTVERLTTDKKYQHRLMDYNNDPDTKFADIKKVLKTTMERVAGQVEKKVPKK